MAKLIYRFVKPNSWVGRLITWRLDEPWSHVFIIIDDTAYSAEIPYVCMLPLDHHTVDMPPRDGFDIELDVTDEELAKVKDWCENHIGMLYDVRSILGWALGMKWIQSPRRFYCFEFCRNAMVQMGWLAPCSDLIRGERLLREIRELARHSIH